MALLEIDNLQTHFRTPDGINRAVDGLSLEVPEGSVFGLLGENGAGKTTTIQATLGLIQPSAGRLEVPVSVPYSSTCSRTTSPISRIPSRMSSSPTPEKFSRIEEPPRPSTNAARPGTKPCAKYCWRTAPSWLTNQAWNGRSEPENC